MSLREMFFDWETKAGAVRALYLWFSLASAAVVGIVILIYGVNVVLYYYDRPVFEFTFKEIIAGVTLLVGCILMLLLDFRKAVILFNLKRGEQVVEDSPLVIADKNPYLDKSSGLVINQLEKVDEFFAAIEAGRDEKASVQFWDELMTQAKKLGKGLTAKTIRTKILSERQKAAKRLKKAPKRAGENPSPTLEWN